MTTSKEQREMMSADLWSRAARRVLDGEHESAMRIADRAMMLLSETDSAIIHYRNGLHIAGATFDDVQAAVTSIRHDGKHPVDSLLGKVEKMYADANEAPSPPTAEHSLFKVLVLLGVES